MMRVLYWAEMFWPYVGGAEVFGTELIHALQQQGHEVIVVTSQLYFDLPDEARYKGIPIYRFPFRKALTGGDMGLFIRARRQVARLKQSFKPDLIHINAVSASLLFHLQTADAHPAPVLVRINTEIFPSETGLPDTLTGQVLRTADWIICVSSATLAQVRRRMPQVIDRSSVIYNGVDVPHCSPRALPMAPPQLLCLGRLIPDKGFDVALAAVALLIDRFPHVRLVIAGDGPARRELEQQAAELGLCRVVEFVGPVEPEQVPAILNRSTIVLMPSRREGLPLVAIEAALLARPVVATRVGGLPEVVVHQQTGLLVERDDSRALAEAVAFLLSNPERASEMGRTASPRARETFSWRRCVHAYDDLYQRLIKEFARRDSAH